MTERSKQILKSAAQNRTLELRAKIHEHQRDKCFTDPICELLEKLIEETEIAIHQLEEIK